MKGIKAHFRRYFFTGLLVVVPLYFTVYIFSLVAGYIDKLIAYLPVPVQPDTYLPFHIPGLGIIFTVVFIVLIGLLTTNLLGKKLLEIGEGMLASIPFIGAIYKPIKQFMETFFVSGHSGFNKVVLVEFPRKGIYSVGFITGVTKGEVQDKTKENVINVFLPTTPNPTSGYYILVPEHELISLDMRIEDAFKLIITGGMMTPDSEPANGKKGRSNSLDSFAGK